MSWMPDHYRELRSRLSPDRVVDDVAEELALHIELRAAELEASGMSAEAARAEAQRRFGDIAAYRNETCAIDESILRERRRMELMDAIRRETRHSMRALLRAPVFTVVAVLTLGLGIGATTAIFTLLDSIVLRPLPYAHAERLVVIGHAVPKVGEDQVWGNSVASYFYYLDNQRAFDELGAYTWSTFNISGDGAAERIDGAGVTASLLRVLSARAILGRLIQESDETQGSENVVVLSHDLWQSRYGGDTDIVGRTITLNSIPWTVVGVMAPGFELPGQDTRVWQPLKLDRVATPVNFHWVQVFGRVHEGVAPEAAQASLQSLADRLPEVFPNVYGGGFYERTGFHPKVTTLREMVLGKDIEGVLWLLFAAVSLVLLIACANVANLLLVRAEARRREHTVRAALGAERAHLAVHHLTESALLALAAALLGAALAYVGVKLVTLAAPAGLPRLEEVALSGRSLAFAITVALITALVFGLMPVIRARTDFNELRESGRGATPSRERQLVRSALVVGQVAMALVLLAAGALLLQSFVNLRSTRSGIGPQGVLTFQAFAPFARYPNPAAVVAFHRELTTRVEALPGVASIGATSRLPLTGNIGCAYTVIEGHIMQPGENSCLNTVHLVPGYFESLQIPIVRGRAFTWADLDRRAPVALVSRAFAEQHWSGDDPIGKRLISYRDAPPWYEVIGVVEDVLSDGLDQPPLAAVYYMTRSMEGRSEFWSPNAITFVVKTTLDDPATLTQSIRDAIAAIDREVPVATVRTMDEVLMTSPKVARTSFTMMLLGIAGGMALFLSAVGLYGVIAYLVGRRRAEIGVRMALGARVSEIARLVLAHSVRLAGAGIVIGTVAALLGTRLLGSLLYDVRPTDLRTLLAVSTMLFVIAVLASVVPARRAARTDPSEALRAD